MSTRNKTLCFAAGIAAAVAPALASAQDSITISSWGGAYQEAQRKALFDRVEQELGIKVLEDTTSGIADVRLQVASGKPTWDIVQQDNYSCMILEKEGLTEELDDSVLGIEGIAENLKSKTWVANIVYSVIMAWNSEVYKGPALTSWADFWDAEKFPGMRSLRSSPDGVLESALLADGVPMDELYPLDVDRAFAKLEEIKPNIAVWWKSGAQSAQLLMDGEAEMVGLWNGRADALQKDGAPIEITFNQQILLTDCWVIPKGTANKDMAMKAIAIMSSAEAQADLTKYINYGPSNSDAFKGDLIPEDVARALPNSPENNAKGFFLDAGYWTENLDELNQRFGFFIQE